MEGKSVIVTGGAGAGVGGTGRYIANKLADEDYAVTIWDVQDEYGLEVVDHLRSKGKWASYVHCDVGDEDQVKEAVEKTYEQTGRIDALVNNAAWKEETSRFLHEVSLDEWNRHIRANLTSHFIVCRYVIPRLIERSQSAIVNVGSIAGRQGMDGFTSYAAAKAGLESMTRSIAAQYGRDGLRCNCVVPGLVMNSQLEAMLPIMKDKCELVDVIDRHAALPSGHGDGMCVADAVEFLLSDAARWITGESLVVDGGSASHGSSWADLRDRRG